MMTEEDKQLEQLKREGYDIYMDYDQQLGEWFVRLRREGKKGYERFTAQNKSRKRALAMAGKKTLGIELVPLSEVPPEVIEKAMKTEFVCMICGNTFTGLHCDHKGSGEE